MLFPMCVYLGQLMDNLHVSPICSTSLPPLNFFGCTTPSSMSVILRRLLELPLGLYFSYSKTASVINSWIVLLFPLMLRLHGLYDDISDCLLPPLGLYVSLCLLCVVLLVGPFQLFTRSRKKQICD